MKRGFELSAGEHTLYVVPREQDAKVDWLVLTLDPTLVPALIYPEERTAEVIRQIPETIGDIPQSIPITLTLYVTDRGRSMGGNNSKGGCVGSPGIE